MSKILRCCCNQTCCILQCLYNRVRDNEILRTQMESGDPEESVQMINLSQARNLSHPSNDSTDTSSSSVIMPSTPNVSQFSNVMGMQPLPVYPVPRPMLPPPPPPTPQSSVVSPIPTPMTNSPPPEYQLRADPPLASSMRMFPPQPVPQYQSDCKSNFPSCFCKKSGKCIGPMQQYPG